MKKFLMSCAALASFMFCSSANAEMYIGSDVGLSVSKQEYKNRTHHTTHISDDIVSVSEEEKKSHNHHTSYVTNFYTGFKIADYTYLEAGYFLEFEQNGSKTKRTGATRAKGAHVGVLFHVPVTERLTFVPGASVAFITRHTYKPKFYDTSRDLFTPRLVGALQYKVSNSVNLRGYTAWHHVRAACNNRIKLKDSFHFGLGLNYSFDLI